MSSTSFPSSGPSSGEPTGPLSGTDLPEADAGLVASGDLRPLPQLLGVVTIDRAFVAGLLVASVAFFSIAFSISLEDPEYFSRQMISSLTRTAVDPINTGAVVDTEDAIPVPRIVRTKPLVPSDFQIVMVFRNEAILATAEELWRVRAGSIVPGLGEVLDVDTTGSGGVVKASEATLRTVAR